MDMSDVRKYAKGAGSSLSRSGDQMIDDSGRAAASSVHAVQYKRGGKVRKTGMAKVHKGERVIPAGKRKKVERLMKRSGMRMKASGR
jgi:SLT domain-containing protein